MTPEEAESFYEEDEDAQKLFDLLCATRMREVERYWAYIHDRYGSRDPDAPGWYERGGDLS